jgi:hypothetical protein
LTEICKSMDACDIEFQAYESGGLTAKAFQIDYGCNKSPKCLARKQWQVIADDRRLKLLFEAFIKKESNRMVRHIGRLRQQ